MQRLNRQQRMFVCSSKNIVLRRNLPNPMAIRPTYRFARWQVICVRRSPDEQLVGIHLSLFELPLVPLLFTFRLALLFHSLVRL